jgi:hypothetical protein
MVEQLRKKKRFMRIWSINPVYLDAKGLVALWREGLLAKKVLENRTRGYVHHPQLIRFRAQPDPLAAIHAYLHVVYVEAIRRGYHFDPTKVEPVGPVAYIAVTSGQLQYEFDHLLRKLHVRDPRQFLVLAAVTHPQPHPLFIVQPGGVEDWEKQ